MRNDDAVIRVQTLGERWETLGVERFGGVRPENLQLASNDWGSDTIQFKMRRDPGAIHPDLSAFTPCEVEIAGQVVWEGRIKETPTKDGSDAVVNVSGQGWQYHLDDDVYRSTYVTTDLTQFKDVRSMPFADLTVFNAAGSVQVGDAGIVMGQAGNTAWGGGKGQGVILDLGPDSRGAATIALDMTTLNTAANPVFSFTVRGYDPATGQVSANAFSTVPLWGASSTTDAINLTNGNFNGTFMGFFPNAPRYVVLILGWTGAGGTTGPDSNVKINAMRLFTNDRFQQSTTSILRASDVIYDAAARCAPLINKQIKPNSYYDEVSADAGSSGDVSFATGGMIYYRMSDTGSTETDRSSGRVMDLTGTYTRGVAGAIANDIDTATSFAGGKGVDRLASGGAAPLTWGGRSYTLECWFKRAATGTTANNQVLMSSGTGGTAGTAVWVGLSPTGALSMGHFSDDLVSSKIVNDTNWHHVVATYNYLRNQQTLYLDGAFVASRTPTAVLSANTTGLYVAGSSFSATQPFTGTVDEVAVYQTGSNEAYTSNLGMTMAFQRILWHYVAGTGGQDGGIVQTAFTIPQFDMDSAKTPREVITAVNAYHNWRTRVGIGRNLEFGPKPSAPLFVVGEWAGSEFEDASANSGEDVYNNVRLEAKDPADQSLVVTRQASALAAPGAGALIRSGSQAANPSADTDTNNVLPNFAGGSVTLARDTTTYKSPPASFKATNVSRGVSNFGADFNVVGQFRSGVTYTVFANVFVSNTAALSGSMRIRFGMDQPRSSQFDADYLDTLLAPSQTALAPGSGQYPHGMPAPNGVWTTISAAWTPRADTPVSGSIYSLVPYYDVRVRISQDGKNGTTNNNSNGDIFYVDDVFIYGPGGTIIDKRQFRRTKVLPISNKMTIPAMNQIGDVWLRDHFQQPLKGSLAAHGQGGVRRLGASLPVHPSVLLAQSGELVRLSNTIDPDTGGVGRDGRIAGVAYDHDTRTAQVTLDNARGNVEAFLARLAVVAK